ncbi:hypothetical protein BKA65DRAFT_487995 [Rhexocercosporidium sp. MPI-PUGE-AT-0058]|nr:hypothetical protein BKA65DRAFT_487995 [Rhexocercosporidium sp. MPI-PUGE-AT-0058]
MSAEIKEGATTPVGSPPKSTANPLTPPTAVEADTAATIAAGGTISIDPLDEDAETDSAYGGDESSSTVSIASNIQQYREYHGRTFHNFNTETTSEYCHHMLTLMLDGKLFLAPIGPNPQKVLDVGTGTGIWAIDFADQFPSVEVIGTDISPLSPLSSLRISSLSSTMLSLSGLTNQIVSSTSMCAACLAQSKTGHTSTVRSTNKFALIRLKHACA